MFYKANHPYECPYWRFAITKIYTNETDVINWLTDPHMLIAIVTVMVYASNAYQKELMLPVPPPQIYVDYSLLPMWQTDHNRNVARLTWTDPPLYM